MKIGSNKGKIIAVSFLRIMIMVLFLGGIYAGSRDNPDVNNGALIVMVIFGFAFAASPLRHLNDVLMLYSDKIVLKKRELSFSTPEEIKWLHKRTYFVGTRLKCCKDTNSTGWKEIFFPYNEIDVTYIKEPHEEFVKFYMNTIQGETEHVQARYKVLEILKKVIPAEEKYVPVYAYWIQGSKMISSGKYYAMGITDDRLYIVPLHIAGEEIGYKDSFVITRDSLGKIDSGKPGGGMRFVSLYDKNQKEIFKFTVDEKNIKLDKAYPVNITQTEEFHAFFAKLDEWKHVNSNLVAGINMNKQQFFSIIMTFCDWDKHNDEEIIEPLVEHLSKRSDKEIFFFDDIMAALLSALDTRKNFEEACKICEHSEDTFLYSRCVALINGEEYYNNVKAGLINQIWEMEFEEILYVPSKAWSKKHNKTPDEYPYVTRYSYETGSNISKWK